MKVIKREHQVYKEFKKVKTTLPLLVGKYQYICSSKKGKISLIKLINYFLNNKDLYEIYCLKGALFEDVERFKTKKEAEKQIKKYLK